MVGQTISHYEILEKIGEGGMGVVYKARDTKLDRIVALKFLASHLLRNARSRERFIREAKAAASLDHPNICTVYEIDEVEGQTFIAMAHIEGRSLADRIDAGPLSLAYLLDVAVQTAEGLEAAHRKGVIHRDIKPDNLFVTEASSRRIVRIMDFGLAQLAGGSRLTRDQASLGTVGYMSPEQAQGQEVDATADVWALGVVLYEMATGQSAFQGDYEVAVLYAIVNEPPEPVTKIRPEMPPELERITAKCLAKKREERYQDMAGLLQDLRALQIQLGLSGTAEFPALDFPKPGAASAGQREAASPLSRWLPAIVAGVLLAGIGLWRVVQPGTPVAKAPPVYHLTQMTRDEGLTISPAISPDGKLLAYSSNRAGENLDIFVQQVAGGAPIRLTDSPAADVQPSFSPDGNQIVFFSERDGGGVYVVPTLGGVERLLTTDDGQECRFSPDGKWISYAVVYGAGNSKLFVIPAEGGEAREIETGMSSVFAAIWSPDGKYLIFCANEEGFVDTTFRPGAGTDWYAIPVEGGEVRKLGVSEAFKKAGIVDADIPRGWVSGGTEMIFEAGRNIWKLPVSTETWKVAGPPLRLTAGTGEYTPSTAADGRIAFSTSAGNRSIWFLPLDVNNGRVTGDIRRVTYGATYESFPTLSRDGKKLVVASDRSGNNDIWLKDLETGQQRSLVNTPADERRGVISPDGSRLAFQRVEGDRSAVYVTLLSGTAEVKICEHCRSLLTWSPDGDSLIVSDGVPESLALLNVSTLHTTRIVEYQGENGVYDGVFSPDGNWFAFDMLTTPGVRPVFLVNTRGRKPIPPDQWIKVADGFFQGKPWWSPDGNLLYFYSRRDNFQCIWAQRLDPATKQPEGEPFAVQHFHDDLRVPGGAFIGYGGVADGLYLVLEESKGNVWLAEPQ